MTRARFVMILMVVCLTLHVWVEEADASDVQDLEFKISQLQSQVQNLESKMNYRIVDHDEAGFSLFLFGIFCAWWAQHTNRNPWLWFFLGVFFNIITGIVLLVKNSDDKRRRNTRQFFDQQTSNL